MDDISLSQLIKKADLIINCTPVGMNNLLDKTKSKEIPLGNDIWKNLQEQTILYDLIYTPRPTEWLKLGEKYGCKKIDGLEMLIQQAASSLRLWSGIKEMPINIMKQAAENSFNNKCTNI